MWVETFLLVFAAIFPVVNPPDDGGCSVLHGLPIRTTQFRPN
jgi:hypothetical protein